MNSFLANNQVYQNLIKLQFEETSGNVEETFLDRINPEHIKLYRYFHEDILESLDLLSTKSLESYLKFLDCYQYPEDDFLFVTIKLELLQKLIPRYQLELEEHLQHQLDKIKSHFPYPDPSRDEFLYRLCYYSVECYQVFLKFFTSRHCKDSLLSNASKKGHSQIIRFLVQSGIPDLTHILRDAASQGRLEDLKFLIDQGGNSQDHHLMLYSSQDGHFEIVKYLLQLGVKPISGHYSNDTLHLCAHQGNVEIVEHLLNLGTKVIDETLPQMARMGNLELVKLLFSHSSIPAKQDALYYSVKYRHYEIQEFLQDHGIEVKPFLQNEFTKLLTRPVPFP